jgi:hypothetical protein
MCWPSGPALVTSGGVAQAESPKTTAAQTKKAHRSAARDRSIVRRVEPADNTFVIVSRADAQLAKPAEPASAGYVTPKSRVRSPAAASALEGAGDPGQKSGARDASPTAQDYRLTATEPLPSPVAAPSATNGRRSTIGSASSARPLRRRRPAGRSLRRGRCRSWSTGGRRSAGQRSARPRLRLSGLGSDQPGPALLSHR